MGIDNLIKELQEVFYDLKSGVFIKKVCKEAAVEITEDLDTIFTTCIDLYYSDYSPLYYRRTKSLYDIYKLYSSGTSINWDVPYMYPGGHRVSGEYIYQKMFEEGWHGGADKGKPDLFGNPHPGYMVWRTPAPPGGSVPPYSLWGQPAKKSESPSEHIDSEMNNYFEDSANISGHTLNERIADSLDYVMMGYDLFN